MKTENNLERTTHTSLRVIDSVRELAEFREEWSLFAGKCGSNNTLYLTYDWISIWWRHFGASYKLNIIVITKDGNTIGIFPFFKAGYKSLLFSFECLETIGAVNGNHVGLFRDENATEVIDALFEYIGSITSAKNILVKLDLVPDDSTFYKLFRQKIINDVGNIIFKEGSDTVAPYISLAPGWNDYYRGITAARRNKLRYYFRHNDTGNRVKYKQFNNDNLQTGLDMLFEIHRQRWQNQNIKSPFSNPAYCDYYRDVAETFSRNRMLHFSYLTLDGNTGALLFSIIYNDKFYAMTVARDIRYARFELGHIHYWYVIREAFQRRLKEFDFLRGDEAYKFKWTGEFRKYQHLLISGIKPFGKANIVYHYLLIKMIRFIRNRHSLKEIFSLVRLRAANKKLKTNVEK